MVISNNCNRLVWSDGDIWQRSFQSTTFLDITVSVQYQTIKSTTPTVATFSVNPLDSVRDLKTLILESINKQEKVNDQQLHLIFSGKRLGDNVASLEACGMKDGAKVIVVISRKQFDE